MKRSLQILALILATTGAGQANADIIFSNFGPGDSFGSSGFGIGLVTPSPSTYDNWGAKFTVGATDFTFTSAEAALQVTSGADTLTFGLRSDDAGLPGLLLQSFSASNIPTTNPGDIVTFNATASLTLEAGTTYWLTSEEYSPSNSFASWRLNNTSDKSANALRQNKGPWSIATANDDSVAFRIDGSPVAVPEPGSLTMLSLGGLGLLMYGCWRRSSRLNYGG